jgi:hypothetical protein
MNMESYAKCPVRKLGDTLLSEVVPQFTIPYSSNDNIGRKFSKHGLAAIPTGLHFMRHADARRPRCAPLQGAARTTQEHCRFLFKNNASGHCSLPRQSIDLPP